ncbi:hypothetical protein [Nocardia niwae]|uniref:Uncharacterized protein n=1 Tax=Nocardia niwae TaxID=626084 RepID=A0ABV2XCZ9_9NOCA
MTSTLRRVLRRLFVIVALTVPMSTGVAVAEGPGPGLVFMARAEYLARWGTPQGSVTRSAEIVAVGWRTRQNQNDWSTILWDESDLRGVSTPVRIGNEPDLGWDTTRVGTT